jgi:F0F1-type ATP synthase membrane subunit b/b'
VSPVLTTFLFELINFLLLAALLGWLLFKPVRAAVESRRNQERQRDEELTKRQADVEKAEAEVRDARTAFEADMAQARSARLEAAERDAAAIVRRARDAADAETTRLTGLAERLEDAQLQRLAVAVAAASQDSVRRLLAALEGPDLQSGLVGAAGHALAELDGASLGDVRVESSVALAAPDRIALTNALGSRATSTAFAVVPSLGAGVRITTSRGVIDTTAAGAAAEAERQLRRTLVADARGADG